MICLFSIHMHALKPHPAFKTIHMLKRGQLVKSKKKSILKNSVFKICWIFYIDDKLRRRAEKVILRFLELMLKGIRKCRIARRVGLYIDPWTNLCQNLTSRLNLLLFKVHHLSLDRISTSNDICVENNCRILSA